MANWQGAKVTNKGTALIAKVTAGNTKLNITRVAFGSGNLTNIEGATRLVREIDNAEIITKVQKNNTCTVTVRLTNANFTAAQNISEIGIFATDPDEGEILFAGMVDANPDFVQAASSSTLVAKTVTMGIGYSNSDNVTITLSNTMWVTAEEVLTMISDELRKYGNNTHRINDAVVAANTAQTITSLTDMIGNRIKAITGESTWVGNPANNIKGIQSSITDLLSLVASLPVTNIKDFNKQVISALDQEKLTALGVKYNFDNPNAWSISFGKLFGGLIIQGININPNITTNSTAAQIQLPITFPTKNLASVLSDTSSMISAAAGNDEGARIANRWNDKVNLYSGWDRGLTTEVTIIALGY
nr:MAG TPA: tail-collar fiber protein [Caudoviricetes sp.]